MKKDHKKELKRILNGLRCPKDYVCYTSGRKKLCKAEDIGLESFLVCLEKDPPECTFSVSFGDIYFCQCPLRVYMARRIAKNERGGAEL